MITVQFDARLRVLGEVKLDMTEEEFDGLSEREQNQLLDDSIDWMNVCSNAELDDIEIDDIVEVEE